MNEEESIGNACIYQAPPTEGSRYRDMPGLRRNRDRSARNAILGHQLLAWLTILATIFLLVVVAIAVRWGASAVR